MIGTAAKWAGALVLLSVGIGIYFLVARLACAPVKLANKALDSAEGVVDRTLEPGNVIHNYEWFHDVNQAVRSRSKQIVQQRLILAAEQDPQEKIRLRTELSGQQQSCRDMVGQYNANAAKVNRDLFRGKTAPPNLDFVVCE